MENIFRDFLIDKRIFSRENSPATSIQRIDRVVVVMVMVIINGSMFELLVMLVRW